RAARARRPGGTGNGPGEGRRGAAHVPAGRDPAPRPSHGGARRGAIRGRGAARGSALPATPAARRRGDRLRPGPRAQRGPGGRSRLTGAGMRRLSLLTMVLVLAGCGAMRDAFSAHTEVAGTAAGRLTAAAADSAYRAGTVRVFQHILIRVPPSAVPMVEEQQKKKAEGVLRQVAAQGGAGFGQLARRYSEDPGSKARGGYLPATPRGQFVPAFDSAAWALAPGGLSGVVRSPFGFHIIRRPPLAEVRDSF